MQFFLRYAYAPLFWSGFIGLATWQVGYRQASHAWLVALFLGALGLSFLAERRLPYQPRWNRPHADRLRDVLHASVNESLNALGILALPLLAGVLGFWPVWPQAWPLWLQLLLAIVLADLGITLVHYASHRSALLWRLHAVHHSVQRLYGFNGLMKHPLHLVLEALGGTLPLLLLGVPQTVAALLAFAIGIQLLLQQQRRHAHRRVTPCVRLGTAASPAPHPLRARRRRQLRAVLQRLGPPARHRPPSSRLPPGQHRHGHRRPA